METKLTAEQIEAAAKAAYNTLPGEKWECVSGSIRHNWRNNVIAAAPYLQYPLEPPTEEDVDRAYAYSSGHFMKSTLDDFINRRNAARLPKPDPRREVVMSRLAYAGVPREKLDAATDELLKAIDGVK